MRISGLSRSALTSCVAAALLAACGGSQPPIGAPGAMPQSHAIVTHAERGGSWMLPGTSGKDLIYAVGGCNHTCIFSYPDGKLVGTLSNAGAAVCSDIRGNVFITLDRTVTEYAHGAAYPTATLNLPSDRAAGCAVDPVTNNLAVLYAGSSGANVAVFPNEGGTPALYQSPVGGWSCGYDDAGNLFVDGYTDSGYGFAELPTGSSSFTSISIDQSVGTPGQVQWDGKYITYEDRESGDVKISQLSISGSAATIVGTTKFKLHSTATASWIFGNGVIVPHPARRHLRGYTNQISFFKYPRGGSSLKTIKNISGFKNIDINFQGVTVSVAPSH
jgi:hypothetical protein